ncbi:hypothetical protein, partial [Streptomyces spectabilis]|uniref:hypothetical protein n=1 Tax=Streptomyces spectabilis TaxID=68270 RepID=UPI0033DF92D4
KRVESWVDEAVRAGATLLCFADGGVAQASRRYVRLACSPDAVTPYALRSVARRVFYAAERGHYPARKRNRCFRMPGGKAASAAGGKQHAEPVGAALDGFLFA